MKRLHVTSALWAALIGLLTAIAHSLSRTEQTLLVFLFGFLIVSPVSALTVNTWDRGWTNSSGQHDASNTNYIVQINDSTQGPNSNDFFVFDLSSFNKPIASATLQLFLPSNGYISSAASEEVTLFDVATPISELVADGTGSLHIKPNGIQIFNDLGSGNIYASRFISPDDAGSFVAFDINADGITALNNALGGMFAIGGSKTSSGIGSVFAFTGLTSELNPSPADDGATFLEVTFIPIPPAVYLFGCGLLALTGVSRSKKSE
jgi:hypothetical protein